MDKPGRHRTGLNPNFRILTGMSEHPCRDRIGVRGAHAPPEPMPLLVHDADRRRLLRHVQSDIVRHPNLRWCKPPDDNRPDRGTIDGSRPFRDYPRSTQSPYQRCTTSRCLAVQRWRGRPTDMPVAPAADVEAALATRYWHPG